MGGERVVPKLGAKIDGNTGGRRRRAMSAGAYCDPFSHRAEEIARRAIERADVHGMKSYGPAPAPLDDPRDFYQEAIEELLDAIYYLTRQVARLEDLRASRTRTERPVEAPCPGCASCLSGERREGAGRGW